MKNLGDVAYEKEQKKLLVQRSLLYKIITNLPPSIIKILKNIIPLGFIKIIYLLFDNTKYSYLKKADISKSLIMYLDKVGYIKSKIEGLPVDKDGNPIPWFTYSSIFFISERIKSNMLIFEYGSGNSTIWLSKMALSVISLEHDIKWYNSMKDKISSNVKYLHCDLDYGGGYSKAILSHNDRFHVVVIDGRDRVRCAKNSLDALRDDGVIIWDNSDRDYYQEGYSFLIQRGFKRLDFIGIGACNSYEWCTSIFYRDNNCFGI